MPSLAPWSCRSYAALLSAFQIPCRFGLPSAVRGSCWAGADTHHAASKTTVRNRHPAFMDQDMNYLGCTRQTSNLRMKGCLFETTTIIHDMHVIDSHLR